MNSINWNNPYHQRDGDWLKGNLHTHTSPASGCGRISIEDSVNLYVERGYDFLAISDHCVYTEHKDDRITLIAGTEWNAEGGRYHAGVYSLSPEDVLNAIRTSDQEKLLEDMAQTDALVILNHPNWQLRPHYRREELEQRDGYYGIEIYNGVIERLHGYAISTDKWDYLLANGKRVLGFASDDSHNENDIGLAAIYVRTKTNSPQDIMSSIKSGNFYASSGAVINDIRMKDGVIEIETPDAQEIQVRSDGGKWIHRVTDKAIRFDTNSIDASYIRFTVFGQGAAMAWTQPFFLK